MRKDSSNYEMLQIAPKMDGSSFKMLCVACKMKGSSSKMLHMPYNMERSPMLQIAWKWAQPGIKKNITKKENLNSFLYPYIDEYIDNVEWKSIYHV